MTAIIVKQLLVDGDVNDAVVSHITVVVCVRITPEEPILPGTPWYAFYRVTHPS
jgi:hypothetical protein